MLTADEREQLAVYLPRSVDEAAEQAAALTAVRRGNGELIIVADDDRSVQEITKLTLEANNYKVILAGDGAEALSLCVERRQEVRLVISDVVMPIMNGRALGHALQKLAPRLPIIAFTGAEETDPLVSALVAEGVTLLRKPATHEGLLAAVDAALHPASADHVTHVPVDLMAAQI